MKELKRHDKGNYYKKRLEIEQVHWTSPQRQI
jgi:hypothetical protein